MQRIDRTTTNKALAGEIEKYNTALTEHERQQTEIMKPFEINNDKLATMTAKALQAAADRQVNEALVHRQAAIELARERVRLLEAIAPELGARTGNAAKSHTSIVENTRKAMSKARSGSEAQQSAQTGQMKAAERQFAYAVN